MKILLFTDTICDANGVSRFIQDLANCANKKDIEFKVLSSSFKCKNSSLPKNIINQRPFFRISMPFYKELDLAFPSFFMLKQIAKDFNPDIIHISTPGPVGLSGYIIAKILKKPIAATYHTDFPEYLYVNTKSKIVKNISKYVMKSFYNSFNLVLTRSKKYENILRNDLKITKPYISTLKAGIDIEKFNPKYKNISIWKNYGLDENRYKILYVGRLTKEKNFLFLLKIWERFIIRYPNIEADLIVVGEGEYKNRTDLKNIYFLGHKEKEELSAIYASSTLFISPSYSETLGQTILEALSSSLPVIVSNIGGQIDYVKEDCGYILSLEDIQKWIDAIYEIVKNKKLREEFSINARECIKDLSFKESFEHFIKLHQQIN